MPLPQGGDGNLTGLSSCSGFELEPSDTTTAQRGHCCPSLGEMHTQLGATSRPLGVPASPLWPAVLRLQGHEGSMITQGHHHFTADPKGEKYTLLGGEKFSLFWGFSQVVRVGGEHPGAETL